MIVIVVEIVVVVVAVVNKTCGVVLFALLFRRIVVAQHPNLMV